MKRLSVILMSGLLSLSSGLVMAQEKENDGYNKYSIRPIHESDQMYKKTITRAIDLREKQNKPMFSVNRELTRLIMEAYKRGDIKAYANDSLEEGTVLTPKMVSDNLKMPGATAPTPDEILVQIQEWCDDGTLNCSNPSDTAGAYQKAYMQLSGGGEQEYTPDALYQMELTEDLIFDKQRSRMYYDIKAITLIVPVDHPANTKGFQVPVATFSYKELVEKVFKDNPNAIWYNPQNEASHKSLADAFELRLFSSYIIKVSNPSNQYLAQIYGDDYKGLLASQWAAFELLEYEHNLWEF